MKISTMYLLVIISWFILGLPLNIAVLVYSTQELKKEHTDKELLAIRLVQIVSGLLTLLLTIRLVG